MPGVVARLRQRRGERDRLLTFLAEAGAPAFDVEAQRPIVEARVLEVREVLLGAPDQRRPALAALLGPGGRLRVGPDAVRGFRVEGACHVALDTRQAREPEALRACRAIGSGGGI